MFSSLDSHLYIDDKVTGILTLYFIFAIFLHLPLLISSNRCPFPDDCKGVASIHTVGTSVTESCLLGTTGVLCSICKRGYNRDVTKCNVCIDNSVPLRIGILLGLCIIVSIIVIYCHRRFRRKWQIYKPLWRDFLRVVSINITFAQINSSLPSVLEIQWPAEWHEFVQNIAFVNIDLTSLIGISCIDNYNYYISFVVMIFLPITILVLTAINYHCAKTSMARRFRILSDKDKLNMEEEALHSLFHLADADHSGAVDSAELAGILKALNWKVDVMTCHAVVKQITKKTNDHGLYLLSEKQFLHAMISGLMKQMLENLDKTSSIFSHKSSSKRMSLVASKLNKNRNLLSNREELIKWTLRKNIVSNSLSGATQLLMLAHTPVSRKVFQYFDCNNMSGRHLLRADYDVNCKSIEYLGFMPVVLIVLIGFIIALPGVISFYLWQHRDELYSTSVYQKVGWLYDPYVRGAEFWLVHDVMMKMILTGMLIYIPTTSRAGIATLVCVIACCNLNYFQPHKNKILFWLTQISFLTTTAKYVVALLISIDVEESEDDRDQQAMSTFLISIDVFFMVSSVLAIVISIWVLRAKLGQIQEHSNMDISVGAVLSAVAAAENTNNDATNRHSKTTVVPISSGGADNDDNGILVEKVDDPEEEQEEQDFNNETSRKPVRSMLRHTRSTHAMAHALHNEFQTHEIALRAKHAKRQQKQRRSTQMRLTARLKIRKTKALTKVPIFKDIPKEGIESILECTTYEKHEKDDILCKQGDVSLAFYIIVSGTCVVTVVHDSVDNIRRVGTLKELDFFGEGALFKGERTRNATVTAESEYVQVLLLSRINWDNLLKSGALSNEIVTTVMKENVRRSEETQKSLGRIQTDGRM